MMMMINDGDDVDRVTLVVPACQPGWEEMENLRGNFSKFERGYDSE